jgi:RNA polymerase sigma-70 factor (ECF subfamily)
VATFAALVDRWYGSTVRLARTLARDEDTARRAAVGAWIRTVNRSEETGPAHVAVIRATIEEVASHLEAGDREAAVDPARFEPAGDRWGGWWREEGAPGTEWRIRPGGEALTGALRQLAAGPAAVVLLRDVERLPPAEVEAALGFDPDAQRALLHEGRSALRRTLVGEE